MFIAPPGGSGTPGAIDFFGLAFGGLNVVAHQLGVQLPGKLIELGPVALLVQGNGPDCLVSPACLVVVPGTAGGCCACGGCCHCGLWW